MRYLSAALIGATSLSLLLSACSGPQREKISAWLQPASKFLSRVVEPLQYDYKGDPAQAKASADMANATYYYLLGQTLSQQGDSNQALTAFDRAKSFDGSSASIYLALAQEYLKLNMMEEGVAAARKALELDGKNRDAKILLANLYATAKKYGDAVQLFEEVQKAYPDDEEVMLYIALLEIEQKQYEPAAKRLQTFIKANPDSALSYFYLGRLLQEQGKKSEAEKAYDRAIEIRPGFVQAGSYLAAMQEEHGDRKASLATYEWLAEETDDPTYHKKLGQMLLDKDDYPNAVKAFENYERVEPGNLNNRMRIGLIYLELKLLAKATETFEKVLKESPDSDNVRYYLAAVYEQDKRYKDALVHYEKIPSSSKLYGESFKRRLFLLAQLKRKDEAWKLFESSLANADKENLNKEDLLETGVQYLDNFDDGAKTEAFLTKSLKDFPSSEKLLYLQGSLYEKQGKVDQAVAVMQKLIDRNPDNAGAMNFIGYLWADKGVHLDKAEKMVKQALKLRPKDPFITDSLAWVYFKGGHSDQALKLLEEAFATRPDEPVIAEHLGDVLVKLGRLDQARTYYEMALKLGPQKDSDKKNIEDKLAQVRVRINTSCAGTHKSGACSASMLEPRAPAAE